MGLICPEMPKTGKFHRFDPTWIKSFRLWVECQQRPLVPGQQSHPNVTECKFFYFQREFAAKKV